MYHPSEANTDGEVVTSYSAGPSTARQILLQHWIGIALLWTAIVAQFRLGAHVDHSDLFAVSPTNFRGVRRSSLSLQHYHPHAAPHLSAVLLAFPAAVRMPEFHRFGTPSQAGFARLAADPNSDTGRGCT